jgi:choloylglycine hydrolase
LATLHYLVADRQGRCAVIEFLDGKMICHRNDDSSAMALTNDTYRSSVLYLRKHDGFGGQSPIRLTTSSLDRFVRSLASARACSATESKEAVNYAFTILRDVAQGDFTKWSIVYDVAHTRIHFRTRRATQRRYVDLKKFDYSCRQPVLVLDLSADHSGDVTDQFEPYSPELNRTLVMASCQKTPFLKGIPESLLEMFATYPGTTVCQTAAREAVSTSRPIPAQTAN